MSKLTRRARASTAVCLTIASCLTAAAPALAAPGPDVPAPAPAGSVALGDRALRLGMRGPDVSQLQRMLRRLGFDQPITGYFGALTAGMVRSWESSASERTDGVVDVKQVERMRAWLTQAAVPSGGTTPAAPAPPGSAPGSPPRIDNGTFPAPPPTATGYVFPIRGAHSYGTAINRFGAGRGDHSHQGHDVFARAGTPVLAARGGRVSHRAFQAAAGHYVVIQADDGTDHVYMHLQAPGVVRPGQPVSAGQPVGRVGCTGRCSGDHLHFEIWVGRWHGGGRPVDPLAHLRAWDAGT